jgi:hypothetical protein
VASRLSGTYVKSSEGLRPMPQLRQNSGRFRFPTETGAHPEAYQHRLTREVPYGRTAGGSETEGLRLPHLG